MSDFSKPGPDLPGLDKARKFASEAEMRNAQVKQIDFNINPRHHSNVSVIDAIRTVSTPYNFKFFSTMLQRLGVPWPRKVKVTFVLDMPEGLPINRDTLSKVYNLRGDEEFWSTMAVEDYFSRG